MLDYQWVTKAGQNPGKCEIPVDESRSVLYSIPTMKRKTNVQIVTQFMNEHPLNQAFVMEALARYSKSVTDNKAALVESMRDSFVNGEAWVASAESWVEIENRNK